MIPVRARLDTHLVLDIDDLGPRATNALREEFTRSNPAFHKKRAMGHWIGDTPRELKSWVLEGRWLILPRGSLDRVEETLSSLERRLDPIRDRMHSCDPAGLSLRAGRSMRPYQIPAVRHLVDNGRPGAIVRGGCGSGKTVVLLGAIAEINQPAIVVVHSIPLLNQWRKAVSHWLGVIPGEIRSGKFKLSEITIATQASLWSQLKKGALDWFDRYGVLVGDEIHRWAAKTFQSVAAVFPAAYRIGASADERRKDQMEHLIYETFGSEVYKIKRDECLAAGSLLPVKIEVVPTGYSDLVYLSSIRAALICEDCGGKLKAPDMKRKARAGRMKYCEECNRTVEPEVADWGGMINRMVDDEERNDLIEEHVQRVLENPKARILILNERVEACRRWAARLELRGISAGLMIGGPENRKELDRTISGIRSGTIRVAVGTTVADEGLDLPALSHVFCSCPVHTHKKRLKQMIGRAARPHEDKQHATCVYFWDQDLFPPKYDGHNPDEHSKSSEAFLRALKRSGDELVVL